VTLAATGRRFRLRHVKARGFAYTGQDGPEPTTPDDAACGSGHLLIGIIDHGHNDALDLLRRVVRWRT
jgi:hypothetical protein